MLPFLTRLIAQIVSYQESILVGVLLGFALVSHGYNMYHFPFFENDEGTYLAQAWSVVAEGSLAPYTYWYDHAPLGWIFTALWLLLTGGLFRFGFSLYSARVFMLVIHAASTLLLYLVTKKMTHSKTTATLSCLLFSISPLAIYFQRRLLLDNLMVFWLLISLAYILYSHSHIKAYVLSALTFGLAVLTKENAVFFAPVFLWLVFQTSYKKIRNFSSVLWVVIMGMVVSFYPLYALLKGELFPPGSWLSSAQDHVSLLGTLKMQAGRGTGLPFWSAGSDFMLNLNYWYGKDPLLIYLGIVALVILAGLAFVSKKSRTVLALNLAMLAFLCSGKLVINFYIIPLIPFLVMAIALAVQQFGSFLDRLTIPKMSAVVTVVFVILVGRYYLAHSQEPFLRDETSRQVEAVNWIKQNISPDKAISIDFYGYSDLAHQRFPHDPVFSNADWFWKVELDPDIRDKKLASNYKNLEYVMVTAEVQRQLVGFPKTSSLLRHALANSQPVAAFAFGNSYPKTIDLFNQEYPNGDWVVIYQQQTPGQVLEAGWNFYKQSFINSEGQVSDPYGGQTTSEGQAYALLRAVWMNDQQTFDKVWQWTKTHLQQPETGLFTWKWSRAPANDRGTAADGDIDMAVSLAFAAKQWDNALYLEESKRVITGIWTYEIKQMNKKPYLVAGNWAKEKPTVIINPSYLAPYAFRIFAEIDPEHDWLAVVDSSYEALKACATSRLNTRTSVGLPPNWCEVDNRGRVSRVDEAGLTSTDYGYDAIRTYWRLALDYQWYQELRAKRLLKLGYQFLEKEWQSNGKIVVTYTHDGQTWEKHESVLSYAANLPVFIVLDKDLADTIYKTKVLAKFYESFKDDGIESYWEDPQNYYTQNWAWFGTGLYGGKFKNLWHD